MSNANQNVADFGVTNGWSEFRLRPEFVDKFTQTDIDGNGDKRCKFFTNGQSKDVTSMTDETTGYLSEKWSNLKDDGTAASNTANDGVETDYPLFRLADVYLMYAECVARTQGASWDPWPEGKTDAADPEVIASRKQGVSIGSISSASVQVIPMYGLTTLPTMMSSSSSFSMSVPVNFIMRAIAAPT